MKILRLILFVSAFNGLLLGFVSCTNTNLNIESTIQNEEQHRKRPTIIVEKAASRLWIDGKATERDWKETKNYASDVNGYILSKTMDRGIMFDKNKMAKVKVFKMLWNKKGLYCYMKVDDKTRSGDPAGDPLNSDCIEYYIDANNLKRESYGRDKNEAQYRFCRDGKIVTRWNTPFERSSNLKNDRIGKDNEIYYTQEVLIRWSGIGATKAEKDRKIGFDIQVSDAVKNNRTYQIVWNSWDHPWEDPSTMGTVKLI